MVDADVIVVGGGHNGLICASYLARAGVDTLLLEARSSVGGCASTVDDLGARFNICHCDHTLVRAMPVIDELELADHGLLYLEPDAAVVWAFHDRSEPWVIFHDTERTIEGLAQVYPDQVDPYRRYLADAIPVARLVLDMARTPPSAVGFASRALRNGPQGITRLLDWSRHSLVEVLGRYFDDWRLVMPAAAIGPTVWGLSPDAPGTGLAATGYAIRHLVRSGRPVGGSGALTDAVQLSFETAGGQVRCEARVESLVLESGSVAGIRMADGEVLSAPVVVAACDPARVFSDWLVDPPASARRLVDRWRRQPVPEGYESKLDGVLTGLPAPGWAASLTHRHSGLEPFGQTTIVSPDPVQLAESHALRSEGRIAERPTMFLDVPSVLDQSMIPSPGRHVLSLEVLLTPYSLRGGWPGSTEPERWLGLWADLMESGAIDLVEAWRAMTPDRYEAEFSMHRGHTPSFSGSPLAVLSARQPELTRYRTAIDGLYLSGAATYPGAGIVGVAGRNAAHVVLRDLRRGTGRLTVAPGIVPG
ncbi:MAG: phytoene dehydrogenase [Acidimicrobiaceae bacterium]|nr:phytoene dehydrogenase [Acidimicrobiaceae bacterium]